MALKNVESSGRFTAYSAKDGKSDATINNELIAKHKAGDLFALNDLCECNKGLIGFIAKKFRGLAELDDLIQVGWEGFLKAVDTYDPKRENAASFSTWAIYYIRGHILRYLSRQPKDVKSLQETVSKEDEDTFIIDTLVDPDAELEHFKYAERRELRQELERVMNDCLSLVEREVVKLRVAWNGGKIWNLEDIAQAYDMLSGRAVLSIFDKAMWRILRSKWGREQIRMMKTEKLGRLEYNTEASALERLEWEGY